MKMIYWLVVCLMLVGCSNQNIQVERDDSQRNQTKQNDDDGLFWLQIFTQQMIQQQQMLQNN